LESLINLLDNERFLLTLSIIGVIATVVSIYVTILTFSDKLQRITLMMLGGKVFAPRINGVAGIWASVYEYPSEGIMKKDYHMFEITQFSNRFKGISLTLCYGQYYVEGIVNNDLYVSGIWESRIARDKHTGAFQFISNNYGNKMIGRWIGYNSTNKVQDGKIEWIYYKNKLCRKEKKRLRNMNKEEFENFIVNENITFSI
jgi:hypothetical protein